MGTHPGVTNSGWPSTSRIFAPLRLMVLSPSLQYAFGAWLQVAGSLLGGNPVPTYLPLETTRSPQSRQVCDHFYYCSAGNPTAWRQEHLWQ